MKNCFIDIQKLLAEHEGNIDTITIVNKDGIIEYNDVFDRSLQDRDFSAVQHNIIGRHILEAYPHLTEESSSVMQVLKTGKPVFLPHQTLESGNVAFTIASYTYPVLDEKGNITGAVDATHLMDFVDKNPQEGSTLYLLDDIITTNMEMQKIKRTITEVAKTDSSVFIYGETGTGKELVAESLHTLSHRSDKPFVAQNCASIPEALLESTFFGTEKGGFTGAEVKKGLFEIADGGTLFLDEINSLSTAMQAKLLRAIEEQKVRKIGGEELIDFDVRLVCASNEEPASLILRGRMRSDFFYRVSVVNINLPPLRDRGNDVLLLADYFIEKYNEKMDKNIRGMSHMVQDLFLKWLWPGNVRELKSTIEGAFNIETSDTITLFSVSDLLARIEFGQHGTGEGLSAADKDTAENPVPFAGLTLGGQAEAVLSQRELPENRASKDRFSLASVREQLQEGTVNLAALLAEYEAAIIEAAVEKDGKLNLAAAHLEMSPQKLNYRISKLGIKAHRRGQLKEE